MKQTFLHARFVICFSIRSQRRSDVFSSFSSHCLKQALQEEGPRFFLLPLGWWITSVFKIHDCPSSLKAGAITSKAGNMEECKFLCCAKSTTLSKHCFIIWIFLYCESLGTCECKLCVWSHASIRHFIHASKCGGWAFSFHAAKLLQTRHCTRPCSRFHITSDTGRLRKWCLSTTSLVLN